MNPGPGLGAWWQTLTGTRVARAALGLVCLAILSACAGLDPAPRGTAPAAQSGAQPASRTPEAPPAQSPAAAPRDPAPAASAPQAPPPAPLAAAPAPRRGPIDERRIELNGSCVQTEEDGFREQARLLVRNNEVRLLAWQLWVGRKGSCRFDHADFRQTRSTPHIELLARDGSGCKLMVWQDPRRVTLAHAGCQKRCSGSIYEQAWPVMFDPASGACANIDR